jgi:hypothetical protein
MNDIIDTDDEGQFANGQNSRDLRLNSARAEFSAPENWERERQPCGSQFLSAQIDADERLPGYLRKPHLPRIELRSARNFAKQRIHRGDPLSVLPITICKNPMTLKHRSQL